MSWKEEKVLDGVFREELLHNTMTEAEQAKARMEEAVYGGALHAEEHTANRLENTKQKQEKPCRAGLFLFLLFGDIPKGFIQITLECVL